MPLNDNREPVTSTSVTKAFRRVTEIINHRRLLTWTTKGGMAIVDQGLITGSNFVLSILLARWLSREEYGAFALGFAVFLLVATLYQALLLEPMSVFGGADYYPKIRTYFSTLLRIHLIATILIIAAIGGSAQILHLMSRGDGLPGALTGVALCAPCVLLLWLARRVFYLRLSANFAVIGASVYCLLLITGLFLAHARGLLSSFSAFALTGLSALLSSMVLLLWLKSKLRGSDSALEFRAVWSRHWKYGRWALLSAAAMWIPANTFYPLVGSFSGVASAGELKALLNFFNPIFQVYSALSLLLLPYASRRQSQGAEPGSLSWKITLLCITGTVCYWLIVILFQRQAFAILYGGRYREVAPLLPVVALGSVFDNAFFGPAIVLRAMESPKSVFAALLVAAVLSVAVGVPATWAFGVKGAVWTQSLSAVMAFGAAGLLLRRRLAALASLPLQDDSSLLPAQ